MVIISPKSYVLHQEEWVDLDQGQQIMAIGRVFPGYRNWKTT